jgi:hypothetical protein
MMDGDEDPQPSELTDSVINGTNASAHTPPATVVATAATTISPLSETTHEKLPPLAEILHDTDHFRQIKSDEGGGRRGSSACGAITSCHSMPRRFSIMLLKSPTRG